MYRGSTMDLTVPDTRNRPYLFFVFDDGLVIVQPPQSVPTYHGNEYFQGNQMYQENTMRYVEGVAQQAAHACKSSSELPPILATLGDEKTRLHIEHITMKDITAEVSKKSWVNWQITLITKKQRIQLMAGKKYIMNFANLLAEPLGDRLVFLNK